VPTPRTIVQCGRGHPFPTPNSHPFSAQSAVNLQQDPTTASQMLNVVFFAYLMLSSSERILKTVAVGKDMAKTLMSPFFDSQCYYIYQIIYDRGGTVGLCCYCTYRVCMLNNLSCQIKSSAELIFAVISYTE